MRRDTTVSCIASLPIPLIAKHLHSDHNFAVPCCTNLYHFRLAPCNRNVLRDSGTQLHFMVLVLTVRGITSYIK